MTHLSEREKAIMKYESRINNDPEQPTIIPNFLVHNTDITTQELGDYLLDNFQWKIVKGRGELNFGKAYSYGKHKPNLITEPLQILLNVVNQVTHLNFNQIYCNYYPNGSVGLGEHMDDEPEHKHNTIACLSLGATRIFRLERKVILLDDDDLILFNRFQRHSIPMYATKEARLSITFREFF